MPSIPLPFVVSFVLGLVLIRMVRRNQGDLDLFHLFVALCAVQASLSGLHWGVGWQGVGLLQPILAAVLPPLAFTAFARMQRDESTRLSEGLPHLAPMIVVLMLVAVWRTPIDFVLFAIYLGYGIALLRIARSGPDAFAAARLVDAILAYRASIALAVLLVLTAFIDAAVSLTLVYGTEQRAMGILSVASVLWLAAAGYAATVAEASRPEIEEASVAAKPVVSSPLARIEPPTFLGDVDERSPLAGEDASVVRLIDELMKERFLYRDPDLTLARLARRVGMPARQISSALNRVRGRNVSQVINEYRVVDAQRRLASTSDPVTVIMLESGFGTKSNFNREFLRLTGMTPSAYRRSGAKGPAAPTEPGLHVPS